MTLKYLPNEFTIKILRDDGLNRHLHVRIKGDSDWKCDLITWPEYLCIAGSAGSYVFSGTHDMFHLFRDPAASLECFAGASVAADRKGGLQVFSRARVREIVEGWISKSGESPMKRRAVEAQIYSYLDDAETTEVELYEILMDFAYDAEIPFAKFYPIEDFTENFITSCAVIMRSIKQYDVVKFLPPEE